MRDPDSDTLADADALARYAVAHRDAHADALPVTFLVHSSVDLDAFRAAVERLDRAGRDGADDGQRVECACGGGGCCGGNA